MDEEKQVANQEVKETTEAETTPQERTEGTPTESAAVVKEEQGESLDRFDKHPRFQELNERAKRAEAELKKYQEFEREEKLKSLQQPAQDPYAGLSAEEKALKEYDDIKSTVKYLKQTVDTQNLNTQVSEAKSFASQVGINLDEKLPEIVDYLSRPENRGRLTATEAVLNLYKEDIINYAKTSGLEAAQKQKEELMEKKKSANLQSQTVSPATVTQSDVMKRQGLSRQERLMADIKAAQEMVKRGERNPKVRVE